MSSSSQSHPQNHNNNQSHNQHHNNDRESLIQPPDPPDVSRRLVRVTGGGPIIVPPGGQTQNGTTQTQSTTGGSFVQPAVREIHKNAWLKRLSSSEKKLGRKVEKFWVVFCVHDDVEAFLEFYSDPKGGVTHRPLTALSLNSCLHVSPSLMGQEEFAVTLPSQVVRLLAHNWDQMIEWVESLQGKLRDMNIISPKDNFYSKPPEISKPSGCSTRDPNSPLPPTPHGTLYPISNSSPWSGEEGEEASGNQQNCDDNVGGGNWSDGNENRRHHEESSSSGVSSSSSSSSSSGASSTSSSADFPLTTNSNSNGQSDSNRVKVSLVEIPSSSNSITNSALVLTSSVYEHLFVPSSKERNGTNLGPSSSSSSAPCSKSRTPAVPSNKSDSPPPPLIPRRNPLPKRLNRESVGQRSSSMSRLEESSQSESDERRTRVSNPEAPSNTQMRTSEIVGEPMEGLIGVRSGEYRIRREEDNSVRSPLSNLPLKEQQVMRLQTEINHPLGVRVVLRKKDCVNTIAFVDYQGAVWIGGWKQREHPVLYYAFHVGDQVIKVAGVTVQSSLEANRAIRMVSSMQVEFIIRRLPYGQVFVIKRSREGEPLGLVAEGASGEISQVLTTGLAYSQGLPLKGIAMNGGEANWYLTEINNRPLSLLTRDNEVKERLNAVGKEISILVQPADLVKHLRKSLKSIKGFKDFIVG